MELLLLAEPTADQTYQDLLARDKTNYVAATFAKARAYLDHPLDEPGAFDYRYYYDSFIVEVTKYQFYWFLLKQNPAIRQNFIILLIPRNIFVKILREEPEIP